jgi:magnesium transporter
MMIEEFEDIEEQRLKKIGLLPGSVVYIGDKNYVKPKILLVSYDKESYEEEEIKADKEEIEKKLKKLIKKNRKNWLIVIGVNNTDIVEHISSYFGLHPLTIEDIVNTLQRPKLEKFEAYGYYFFVIKILEYINDEIEKEQISIIMKDNLLISFHETDHKIIETIKNRLKRNRGDIRSKGLDFLLYSIIDVVVDSYFAFFEEIGNKIEIFEYEITKDEPNNKSLFKIQNLERKLLFVRKVLWPLREVVNRLYVLESKIIKKSTKIYFRDIHDHTIQLIETLETYREILNNLVEMQLLVVNNRLNEIMKTLTIITAIFTPLTFIASIYGMNFEHMPELKHPLGYYAVLIVFVIVATIMALYFKKKGWI